MSRRGETLGLPYTGELSTVHKNGFESALVRLSGVELVTADTAAAFLGLSGSGVFMEVALAAAAEESPDAVTATP